MNPTLYPQVFPIGIQLATGNPKDFRQVKTVIPYSL